MLHLCLWLSQIEGLGYGPSPGDCTSCRHTVRIKQDAELHAVQGLRIGLGSHLVSLHTTVHAQVLIAGNACLPLVVAKVHA